MEKHGPCTSHDRPCRNFFSEAENLCFYHAVITINCALVKKRRRNEGSAIMEVKQPVVLARLPRSLQDTSQPKHGPVYGLTRGQKRKRHEVSIAIDGNSVNLYDV